MGARLCEAGGGRATTREERGKGEGRGLRERVKAREEGRFSTQSIGTAVEQGEGESRWGSTCRLLMCVARELDRPWDETRIPAVRVADANDTRAMSLGIQGPCLLGCRFHISWDSWNACARRGGPACALVRPDLAKAPHGA